MAKAQLKVAKMAETIKGMSPEEQRALFAQVDTHRAVPKASGGEYTPDNYDVISPVEHMKHHGIYRERDTEMETLKAIIDDTEQVRKVYIKVHNQLLAYKRRVDTLTDTTREWLETQSQHLEEELTARERLLAKQVKEIAKSDTPNGKLASAALGVRGVGPVTVAYCMAYIDLEKARHASSLWAYTGLDKASHERYTKGEAGGGNKTLRTKLYTLADSQVKSRGAYREVYDNTKARLAESDKVVKTRNTQGKLIECAWKDAKPSHRHGAAMRKVMKHFLADWWFVGRTLHGLDTSPLYPEAMLGGNHRTIMPEERGWVY